jgi:hypothetical protein
MLGWRNRQRPPLRAYGTRKASASYARFGANVAGIRATTRGTMRPDCYRARRAGGSPRSSRSAHAGGWESPLVAAYYPRPRPSGLSSPAGRPCDLSGEGRFGRLPESAARASTRFGVARSVPKGPAGHSFFTPLYSKSQIRVAPSTLAGVESAPWTQQTSTASAQ